MILVLSLVLALVPLAGVAWMFVSGMISIAPPSATVDGLFMSLILLTVSACFLLNSYWEARDKGLLAFAQKKKQHRACQRALHLWRRLRALHRPRLARAGSEAPCRKGEFLMATQVATLARPAARTSTGVMLPAFTLWWREIVRFYRQTGRVDRGAGFSPGFLGSAGIRLRNVVPFRRRSGPAALPRLLVSRHPDPDRALHFYLHHDVGD